MPQMSPINPTPSSADTDTRRARLRQDLQRRLRDFGMMARDPVLLLSLIVCGLFLFIFILFPIFKTVINGFFDTQGQLDLRHFARFADSYYGPLSRKIFYDTLTMGVLSALGGTVMGFIFAYAVVRCNIPGKRWVHILALVPTVSPPFAIALSMILLFGRNGLITRRLFGIVPAPGMNDIYGMDGLVLVQVITFFSASYLILRAMLERVEPSLEEAAESMGANRFHIFRTVTVPLLTPGLAGAFLLLFVESLADLGNPLFISGNVVVLSSQIFLAISGEYDFQKASALSLVLLLPTLIIFLVQRYYVSRRSYVSVTGKPTGGRIVEKEPWIRWPFIIVTYLFCALIVLLYLAIFYGSFSKAWGVNFAPTLEWWSLMLTRGIEPIMDTTYLSIIATPVAALIGMVIAFLVVRKTFTGKGALDFGSNLGGAVPGTILGIGYVLAFNTPPLAVVVLVYTLCAFLIAYTIFPCWRERLIMLSLGTAVGVGVSFLDEVLGLIGLYYLLGALYAGFGLYTWLARKRAGLGRVYVGLGVYLFGYDLCEYIAGPIAAFSRSLPRGFWSNAIFQLADHVKVPFQIPPSILAIGLLLAGSLFLARERGRWRLPLAVAWLAIPAGLMFTAAPLALVGGPFIIIAAYAVRSLPASVRAGVAALQQIDPTLEEASNILGADAEYTFRKVTLPLILPALLAGLIFSFTRHMTSLSAVLFLVSARWRIVTAAILSEWEQGGVGVASAYSTTIILFVLAAIGLLYFITHRVLSGRGDVDVTLDLG